MVKRKVGFVLFCIIFAALCLITTYNWVDRACYWYVSSRIEAIATNPDAMMFSRTAKFIERNKSAYYQIYNMGDIAIRYLYIVMERNSSNTSYDLRYYIADEIRQDIKTRQDFFMPEDIR